MRFRNAILATIWFLATSLCALPPVKAHQTVIAVGVPAELGKSENYDAIFAELKGAGIDVFMPFSEYQEVPEPKSLKCDGDFFPRYKRSDAAKIALAKHKVKLLVPASVLYWTEPLPALNVDPLAELIRWLGRENIYGVYGFDEPALAKIAAGRCRDLYMRVKKIDSSLPVVMVNAPIPEECSTDGQVKDYLAHVKSVSQWSDITGFDVYPIPEPLMKVKSPFSGLMEYRRCDRVIADYITWLKQELPSKQHIIVLQAFSLKDQGHDPLVAALFGDRRPTRTELEVMFRTVSKGRAVAAFWGQSLLKDRNPRLWQDVLHVTRSAHR